MATHGSLKFQQLPTGRAARSGVSLLQARSPNSRQIRVMATLASAFSGEMAMAGIHMSVFHKGVKVYILLQLEKSVRTDCYLAVYLLILQWGQITISGFLKKWQPIGVCP